MNTLNETSVSQQTRRAAESVHRGIDRAAEALHDTAENAAASAVKLADRANRSADVLREQGEKARATTVNYATQYPLRVLVLSVGLGFVLSKLLQRR